MKKQATDSGFSEEFTRFRELTKHILAVPKREIDKKKTEYDRKKTKSKGQSSD